MNDTPEIIRQQMEETKTQLSEKLGSLEHQVSQTVRSTGTAVNATVGAVQETVETVTGAVHDAVRSVSNALDVRRQIDKHPWLFFGGSVAVGYLAVEYFAASAKKPETPETAHRPRPAGDFGSYRQGPSVAYARSMNSFWFELRGAAIGALVGVVQDVASRAVPHVMNYLTSQRAGAPIKQPDKTGEQGGAPRPHESLEETRNRLVASSENGGSLKELWP